MDKYVEISVKQILILVISLILTGCANGLFYFPDRKLYQTPMEYDLKYETVFFYNNDGIKLHGWFLPAEGKTKGTVLHFHGNAQNISTHFKMVKWLPEKGYNVFTFDYRGYGKSEGAPFRKGVYKDCLAAVKYVAARDDVNKNRLFLIGQSLGGVNSILTAATIKNIKFKAVVIDSAFASYNLIARDKIGLLPFFSWFRTPLSYLTVSDELSPLDYVKRISPVPVLFLHGKKDTVVPSYHAKKLFENAKEPKAIIFLDKGKHIQAFSVFRKRIIPRILNFFEKYRGKNPVD